MHLHTNAEELNLPTSAAGLNPNYSNLLMAVRLGSKSIQDCHQAKWDVLVLQFHRRIIIMCMPLLKHETTKEVFLNQPIAEQVGASNRVLIPVEITTKKSSAIQSIKTKFLPWIRGCITPKTEEKPFLHPAKIKNTSTIIPFGSILQIPIIGLLDVTVEFTKPIHMAKNGVSTTTCQSRNTTK